MSGSLSALAIAFGSSMSTLLSCRTSAITAPYSIPPEVIPAVAPLAIAPAGPNTNAGAIVGRLVKTDSANIAIVARTLFLIAVAASPKVLASPIARIPS